MARIFRVGQFWRTLDAEGYQDTTVRVLRGPVKGRVRCVQQHLDGRGDVYEPIMLDVSEFEKEYTAAEQAKICELYARVDVSKIAKGA